MQRFDWDDSLSVGVKLIDEQHKVWIERLNSLSAAIETHQELGHISRTMNFMVDYVEFHFAAEESLMAAQNYPGIAKHKLEHQKFRDTLKDLLVLELEEDDVTSRVADSVNHFQISWLKNHIQQVDRQFAVFLREKDVALCSNSDLSGLGTRPAPNGASPDSQRGTVPASADLVLPKNPAW
jgi:hemerythrin